MLDKFRTWAAQRLAVNNSSQYKLSDREAMAEIFNLPGTAGPLVNATTAMRVSAVYACVSLIAGAIASMPLAFYKRAEDGGRASIKHDLWWLFNEQPSPLIPAAVFWEYMYTALLLHGDGFALLVRNRNGVITEVLPLSPLTVIVLRDKNTLSYAVTDQYLGTFGVHQDDMLHFFGFGFNGLRCMSVIKHAAAQSIGTALSTDEYATRFFHNGAHPSHVITYQNPVDPKQIDALRARWAQRTAGLDNAHMPLVLTSGATVKELSMTAEDAQLMEVRKFTVIDICRAFGVPPFMVGETEKTSSWGSGVEAMGQGFITFTLMRHLNRAQQEINRKVFRNAGTFAEFNVNALSRGDLKARGDYYRKARGGSEGPGWLTANEIRKLENDPPVDGGDKLYEPQGATNAPKPNAA